MRDDAAEASALVGIGTTGYQPSRSRMWAADLRYTQMCCRRLGVSDHVPQMANYTVVPRSSDDGFDVAVIGNDGARQTILNFRTETDAKAWIVQDERHERRRGPAGE
jgi:hypothetical protein